MDESELINLWEGQKIRADAATAAEAGQPAEGYETRTPDGMDWGVWLVTCPVRGGIGVKFIDGRAPSKFFEIPLNLFLAANPHLLKGQVLSHPSNDGEWRVVKADSKYTNLEHGTHLASVDTLQLIDHNLRRLRGHLRYESGS